MQSYSLHSKVEANCRFVCFVRGVAEKNFYKQYRKYRDSLKEAPRPIRVVQRLEHLRQLAHGKNFKCVHELFTALKLLCMVDAMLTC